jgi:serine/threonine protein kinase
MGLSYPWQRQITVNQSCGHLSLLVVIILQVEREITIHSALQHPHVVDFYVAFHDVNFIYLVMEYAEGVSLGLGPWECCMLSSVSLE